MPDDLKQIQAKGTGTCEDDLCNWDFTAEIYGVYRSIKNASSI